jgi:hypothetical protein
MNQTIEERINWSNNESCLRIFYLIQLHPSRKDLLARSGYKSAQSINRFIRVFFKNGWISKSRIGNRVSYYLTTKGIITMNRFEQFKVNNE